jgi:phosphate starvation-inducible PhoH-like protein
LSLLHKKDAQKIILTRPTVSVENEEIGFLPGNIQDKMSPWTRPIYDNLYEFYTPKEIEQMTHEHRIEVCPLGFMRGRTLKDAILILDEAQNTTPGQMLMLLTRIGPGSRVFISGDPRQSDVGGVNGLHDFLERLMRRYTEQPHEMFRDGFGLVRFDDRHIVRHPIVEKVVSLYPSDDAQ